jgi:Tfp pilus assembly PilM family ATPase
LARQLLAITWEGSDAWCAVASVRSGKPVVEAALHLPSLGGETSGEGTSGHDDQSLAIRSLSDRLSRELRHLNVGKPTCLFSLGRSSIELKHLTLPPAPDEELPDLVRFQAQRDFHALGSQWPLDFIPLTTDAAQPRSVLAAAVSNTVMDSLQALATELESEEVAHVGLRPVGTASLLAQARRGDARAVRIVVELYGDQAELTVLQGETILFLRSAKAPSEQVDDIAGWLMSELRRTIAAVQHRLGEQQLSEISVCAGERSEALTAAIAEQSNVTATVLDPWSTVSFAKGARRPTADGPWGALVGMLDDAAAGRRPAIDFVNPRKRPAPVNRRKTVVQGLVAAALLVGTLLGGAWFYLGNLDSQIKELASKSKKLDAKVVEAKKIEENVGFIDKWMFGDTVWLEELRELSTELPPAEEAMLTKLHADVTAAGGQMQLEGRVSSSTTIDKLEQQLRDDRHVVEGRGSSREDNAKYPWEFKSTVIAGQPKAAAPAANSKGRRPTTTGGARPKAAAGKEKS